MIAVPVTSLADYKTVTGSAVSFDTTMTDTGYYVFTATVASFIAQGAAPTASAADGSTLVAAGESVLISGSNGAKLSVKKATGAADGEGTLTPAFVS